MIQATRDEDHQRLRKSLAVSFSESSMKQMEPRIKSWVRLLQTKLAERDGTAVDMVELFRCAVSPSYIPSVAIFDLQAIGGEL
jgi:cytochrome P450